MMGFFRFIVEINETEKGLENCYLRCRFDLSVFKGKIMLGKEY